MALQLDTLMTNWGVYRVVWKIFWLTKWLDYCWIMQTTFAKSVKYCWMFDSMTIVTTGKCQLATDSSILDIQIYWKLSILFNLLEIGLESNFAKQQKSGQIQISGFDSYPSIVTRNNEQYGKNNANHAYRYKYKSVVGHFAWYSRHKTNLVFSKLTRSLAGSQYQNLAAKFHKIMYFKLTNWQLLPVTQQTSIIFTLL